MKGNLAMFGLTQIARLIHQIEDTEHISEKEISKIEEKVDAFLIKKKAP